MNTTVHYCPRCRKPVEYTVQPSLIDPSPRCPGCLTKTTELGPGQTPVLGVPMHEREAA